MPASFRFRDSNETMPGQIVNLTGVAAASANFAIAPSSSAVNPTVSSSRCRILLKTGQLMRPRPYWAGGVRQQHRRKPARSPAREMSPIVSTLMAGAWTGHRRLGLITAAALLWLDRDQFLAPRHCHRRSPCS